MLDISPSLLAPRGRSPAARPHAHRQEDLTAGIVHIGVGAFHRAHQGVILNELAQQGVSGSWGVIGIGLRSATDRAALLSQDCRYAVLQRSSNQDRVVFVETLLNYLDGRQQPTAALASLAAPSTKLVTLTVTGNGYGVDASGRLRFDTDIRHDLACPSRPRTVLGLLTEAMRLRLAAAIPPLTVLSCDNLARNGETLRAAAVSFAGIRDERLAAWIERNVAFPASVVDRITPATTAEHRRLLAAEWGVLDACPVVSEEYRQWIVQDEFAGERPPLEQVGVEFVADVEPYELKKKRLLNGTHSALGYLGYLLGHRRLDDALGDPLLHRFAEGLILEEVGRLLPGLAGADLESYGRSLLSRFANPRIGDPLQRLCARGSTKMPAYLLPSLSEAIERSLPHERLTLALAAWIRYLQGVDFDGNEIDVEDPMKRTLQPLARESAHDVQPLLEVRSVFGNLAGDDDFVARLQAALLHLELYGPGSALEACLSPNRLALAA